MSALAQAIQPATLRAPALPVQISRVHSDLPNAAVGAPSLLETIYMQGMTGCFRTLSADFSRSVANLGMAQQILRPALADAESIVTLARTYDDQPVGFAIARPKVRGVFSIVALGVAGRFRRQNVGTALFRSVMSEAEQAGAHAVQVRTPVVSPGFDFFAAQGGECQRADEVQRSYSFGNYIETPRGGVAVAEFWHRIGLRPS